MSFRVLSATSNSCRRLLSNNKIDKIIISKSLATTQQQILFQNNNNSSICNRYNRYYSAESDKQNFTADGKPTLQYVKSMPYRYSSMKHEDILQLCAENIPEAHREALTRNIMNVDNIEYDDAVKTVIKIYDTNQEGVFIDKLPNRIGLLGALTAATVSIPMVFDLNTVAAFNEAYVTADVPEPKDLETWLEVGSWSWAWMEPIIGQASFFILCMQFSRSQLKNLGAQPFTSYMANKRAQRLISMYPQYDKDLLEAFSKSYGAKFIHAFSTNECDKLYKKK